MYICKNRYGQYLTGGQVCEANNNGCTAGCCFGPDPERALEIKDKQQARRVAARYGCHVVSRDDVS